MNTVKQLKKLLRDGGADSALLRVYGADASAIAKERVLSLLDTFAAASGSRIPRSAPMSQ